MAYDVKQSALKLYSLLHQPPEYWDYPEPKSQLLGFKAKILRHDSNLLLLIVVSLSLIPFVLRI